ncbi:DUF6286 domain-containing protein [Kineococcus indalonis]|uniref:DUF6286 domain-containing protein n=1 Tax=Kineococcus indalonis TaxID=2696566 RepID=UPI001413236C|nr:DUF6286 domain-containing protein [Kineococcus indalonis]NAZ87476.1 hypothetical protein [Kineococcus indalonis]
MSWSDDITTPTGASTGTSLSAVRPPMPPAAQATGSGRIGVVGPLLAVLLLALGLLLGREALVAAGALGGSAWLPAAAGGLDGLSAAWWLVPAGLAVALLGLWLVVSALRPRSRRTVPLAAGTGVFVHVRDLARLASGAAREVDGVLSASSSATRRAVTVTVHGTGDVREQVSAAVTGALAPLRTPPRVSVRVRTGDDDERNEP